MATVANLDVRIGADIKSFQQGMANVEQRFKQVGANLRSTGRQLTTTITLPLVGIGAAAVKAASDAEEMQSKFNTVFKTVGGDVTKQLDAFARASGRSRYELRGMAAQLGDIFKPLGYTEQQAGDLSVQVSKLAVDLGSFNNMPMDEALARLRGTLVGSHENALAFGVVINEASLKQELMRMGADKLTGAQLNQAKVQARLNLLMAGTTDAQGDAIRTSDSFANQFVRLKNATYDLGVTIGELLLPHARELVQRLQSLVDYVTDLSPETQKLALRFAFLAGVVGPALFAIGGMASGLSAIFRSMTLLMSVVNPYVAAVAAIASIALLIIRNWDGVNATLKSTKDRLGDVVGAVGTGFKDSVEAASEAAGMALNGEWSGALDLMLTTTKEKAASIIGEIASIYLAFNGQTGEGEEDTPTDPFGIGFMTAQATTGLQTFKDNAKAYLDTADDSVSNSAKAAETALGKIRTEVGNIEALAPSFKTLEDALSGAEVDADDVDAALNKIAPAVAGVEGLAPDFGTLTKALGSETPADKSLVVMSGNAVSGIKGIGDEVTKLEGVKPDFSSLNTAIQESTGLMGGIFDQIPDTLTMPEGYEDIIKDLIPDKDESHRWGQFVVKMGELKDDLDNASDFAFTLSGNLSDVEEAWRPLFGTDSPKWMKDLVKYATDAGLIVQGLEAMVTLLSPDTWKGAWKVLTDLGGHLGKILGLLIDIVVKIGEWILAQAGIGSGGGGAVSGITNPNVATGAVNTATGGGTVGTGLGLLGGATVGATFGIFAYGLQQMLTSTHQSLLEQGLSTAQIGTATSLGGLLQGVGAMGGGTPSWLSGLQGYMGTGGSANTSGFMGGMGGLFGSGSSGSQQTINVNLDGQTIASATMPYWSQELEIYGTNR